MAKIHEYCCCAIPLLNFGIYAVLLEQFVVAITAGTLSIATSKTVGADLPSFAPWVFAIVCYLAAGVQVLGFFGVSREQPKLYRKYATFNSLAVSAVFGVAAGFIGVAWSRHSSAVTACEAKFFKNADGTTETDSKSETLCKVFVYITTGVMTGLWVGLAIVQFYFVLVTKFYGTAQSEDHKRYFSVYGDGSPDDILLNDRPAPDAWDARSPPTSPPPAHSGQYQHVRNVSNASTIMNEPYQQPNAGYEQHYPPPAMHPNDSYQDEYEDRTHYTSPPPGDPPQTQYNHQPQSSYDYPRSPPQTQMQYEEPPFPVSSSTSQPRSVVVPTGPPQVDPSVPRYQLYDGKA